MTKTEEQIWKSFIKEIFAPHNPPEIFHDELFTLLIAATNKMSILHLINTFLSNENKQFKS